MIAGLLAAVVVAAPVEQLNAELLSHDSATAVLQTRCDARGPAGTRIRARQVTAPDNPAAAAEARRDLHVGPNEPLRHRRVELICGETVFSRADNWYLPGRLTTAMNTALETTQSPFGVVVTPLHFQRHTLSAKVLASPRAPQPPQVLRHRAVLATPDGVAFSVVVETYERAVVAP